MYRDNSSFISTRIIEIQAQMSERALELLNLKVDQPALLLDIGCGSGISGEVLNENGHSWIGLDISIDMLRNNSITIILLF